MTLTKNQRAALAAGTAAIGGFIACRALRARRAISFSDRSVVITGGSRGLGLSIARQLAAEGAKLTLIARDEDELDRARQDLEGRGGRATVVQCDVADADALASAIDAVVEREGRIDVLINNAGHMTVGPLEHMDAADFEASMRVHFWAPLHAMRAAVPHMRERGEGWIVNISSIGGRMGVPHLVPYCAGKFALAGLSDAARSELASQGIRVTTVIPGLMRTGSPFNAWFKGQRRKEFTWFTLADSLPAITVPAGQAAARIIDACRHGDAQLVIGWPAKLAVAANAIAPAAVAAVSSLAARVLPEAGPDGDRSAHSGWQSFSDWAPSRLTRLTERAASDNNEVPGRV